MHVQFIKNVQFTKLIKIEGRMREFNFRKPNGREPGLFTVDVSDDRGFRIIFSMSKEETNWKIMPAKLPVWITDSELMLDEIIQEEMKSI